MRKIPTLFMLRDHEVRTHRGPRIVGRCIEEVRPGCEWVAEGQGVATVKKDGTACLLLHDPVRLYKRLTLHLRRVKPGTGIFQLGEHSYIPASPPPAGFLFAQEQPVLAADFQTGEWPGWVPVTAAPEDHRHREGLTNSLPLPPGTYELCGPKINQNPEGFRKHILVPHGQEILPDCPRTFRGLKAYLRDRDIEGVVFWQQPGNLNAPMAKVRKKDFGLLRTPRSLQQEVS